MKKLIALSIITLTMFLLPVAEAAAQSARNRPDLESFYKPVTQKDLRVQLNSVGRGDRFNANSAMFTGNGGCPDQINIGSITDGTNVVGGSDINVVVGGDIIVQCGGM